MLSIRHEETGKRVIASTKTEQTLPPFHFLFKRDWFCSEARPVMPYGLEQRRSNVNNMSTPLDLSGAELLIMTETRKTEAQDVPSSGRE